MSPRPKVERVARSLRLPVAVDVELVKKAGKLGMSVNEAVEAAVKAWIR